MQKSSGIFILGIPKSYQYKWLTIGKIAISVYWLQFIFKTCAYPPLFHFKTVWNSTVVSEKSDPDKEENTFPVETLMVPRRGTSRSSTRNWTFLPEKYEKICREKVHIHPLFHRNMQEKVHFIQYFMHFFLYLLPFNQSTR